MRRPAPDGDRSLAARCGALRVFGAGGTGKTRLAVELAARAARYFEHGACLVDLAPVSRPPEVEAAIIGALGVAEGPQAAHVTPGPAAALARREGGPVNPTWSTPLPMAASLTLQLNHPSASPPPERHTPPLSVSARHSRAAWAPLIKKVCDADPLCCARCHSLMQIIAVITDPAQLRRILRYLVDAGKPPPGLDPACLD